MGKKGIITGVKALDMKLATMEFRVQKKLARRAAKVAAKQIVLPAAKALVPVDTGALEASLKVRALKRTKTRTGYTVQTLGLERPMQAPAVEFGSEKMEADPFLREAIYGNEAAIRLKFAVELKRALVEEGVLGRFAK